MAIIIGIIFSFYLSFFWALYSFSQMGLMRSAEIVHGLLSNVSNVVLVFHVLFGS